MDAKSKKAMHSIGFIKQYEEFAVTARDGGEFRGRRAEITWQHGDRDLILSIGFIKQYEEFAVTARDGGEFDLGKESRNHLAAWR